MKRKDLTGQTFGRLKAIELSDRTHPVYGRLWKCECECGGTAYICTSRLVNGNNKSCGCIRANKKEPKPEYKPKTDCIMFCGEESKPKCDALSEMFCVTKGKCKFYKAEFGEKTGKH